MTDTPTHIEAAHGTHVHPGPLAYIKVALVLACITAAEVAVYYISGVHAVLPAVLLGMSAVKFAIVGLYFMHLKFDTHLFRRLLIMGIVLAVLVYAVALTTLFHYA